MLWWNICQKTTIQHFDSENAALSVLYTTPYKQYFHYTVSYWVCSPSIILSWEGSLTGVLCICVFIVILSNRNWCLWMWNFYQWWNWCKSWWPTLLEELFAGNQDQELQCYRSFRPCRKVSICTMPISTALLWPRIHCLDVVPSRKQECQLFSC